MMLMLFTHTHTHTQFSGHSRRVIAASESITTGNVAHSNQGICLFYSYYCSYDCEVDLISLSLSLSPDEEDDSPPAKRQKL